MNITLFNKKYWVRRFKEPQNIRGYITADHEDFVASLHIHPMGSMRCLRCLRANAR